jgi:hypothetical protein
MITASRHAVRRERMSLIETTRLGTVDIAVHAAAFFDRSTNG